MTINNPVISGMTPDPSIIRVEDTYYIASSTFHWLPAIQLYSSKDLENWELIDYALKNKEVDLRGTSTPAGVWAPHLSFDDETQEFWILYSHMVNMAGREFNSNTYGIHSKSIHGPWSDPIYFTSIGFDPCLFHDDDGKHYLSILEWETRTGYQAPGHIVIAEIDLPSGKLLSSWKRISKGFTTRGCVEAPQLYKRQEYYYLLLASGGTGYAHGAEIGRSKSLFGPYEPHPSGEPIVTSSPSHLFSLGDPDAGHFEMFNPFSEMQKAGHGSLVETPEGEVYLAHLMSRPLPETTLNPLGRECSLQKMAWTDDGWLEMKDGSNFAKSKVVGLKDNKFTSQPVAKDVTDDFSNENYSLDFMTPYHYQTSDWVNTTERPGYLRIYGNNSLFSQYEPAILATKATSFKFEVQIQMQFAPCHYSEKAGLGLYYDANNWLFVHVTFSEETGERFISLTQAKLGEKIDYFHDHIPIHDEVIELKIIYRFGIATISYKTHAEWLILKHNLDVTYLSDEGVNGMPGEIGGFTGLFNFIGAVDAHQHTSFADFSEYSVHNL